MKISSLPLAALALAATAAAAPLTQTDNMRLKRLSDPQLSPDGGLLLYTQTEVDLASGSRNNDLWLQPLTGGEPRRLTTHPKSDNRGRFSPDGRRIAFVSARDGAPQVYTLELAGGEPRRVTSLPGGVGGVSWIDATSLLVAADVYPECGGDAECDKRKTDGAAPSSARVYDGLLYRHWDSWEDARRSHLLVVSLDGAVQRDLTPGDRDVPGFSLGGPDDYAVSPDGKEICFARNDDPVPAVSTNAELWVVPTTGGAPRKIAGSPGYDGGPQYSPDGSRIAFRAQLRAGYESDRWRLMVYDRKGGSLRNLTEGFDRHVDAFAWSSDSRTLFFIASDGGRDPLFAVPSAGEGAVRKLADGGFAEVLALPGGRGLVVSQSALIHPTEFFRLNADGSGSARLTKVNDAFLAGFRLKPGESVSYTGAAGKSVQAWIVKPADFDPARKYPLLVLIHGGPQGVWNDAWSFRWNPQVFANAGYVVFAPNPRGSLGWGQDFVDDINGDWGGRAYEDVMKGTDYAEALPYVDKGRTAAAGASYGGYLVAWIAGHTDRFKALVDHDGLFDLASMYGSTEELWFTDWEFKGPYWENPEMYERWSPSRFVQNIKTPTLVIHGELDYRVPLEQGLGLYTALQRRGVPSRLVVFPDENHWVLKPLNSIRWYKEVIEWLDRWVKG
jgi:dipeptidyl aminopeptidase/acylaminoacyl peptidase